MAAFLKFEDIEAWKKARVLTKEIYDITKNENFRKDFSLKDQIRRAVVSVMSNIAEGKDRGGNKEFVQFLYIAKGSTAEVKSQLYIALDQGYMTEGEFKGLFNQTDEVAKMLCGLINYLKKTGIKGIKYK